jgi:UDP-GlcNAc:undecaprenyl-phosphate GlcNAc-1-phosphate transferase
MLQTAAGRSIRQADDLMFELNDTFLRMIVGFVAAAAMTFAMAWLLIPLAHRYGLLDHPAGRKDHAASTPCTGGLAMLTSILVAFAWFGHWTPVNLGYMAAAASLVLLGVLDDRLDLPWWIRIAAQCVAVWLVFYCGVHVDHIIQILAIKPTGYGMLTLPLMMFVTVGVINAINMCDGVDGLAGCTVFASLCMFAGAALYSGNTVLAQAIFVFAGSVLGFLLMNLRFPWQPRARVFMGNAGSALLGFTVAWVSFRLTQNDLHPVTPILAPWLVATPLIDCVSLIGHRLLRRQSPFRPDREHMHHLMLDAGFTPNQLSLTLMAINLALGASAAVALRLEVQQSVLVVVFVALCLGYFALSWRRAHAVAAFAKLHRALAWARLVPTVQPLSSQLSETDDPVSQLDRDACAAYPAPPSETSESGG